MDTDEWLKSLLAVHRDWEVERLEPSIDPYRMDVHVRFIGKVICPICGRECPRHDSPQKRWRDEDIRGARCDIHARVPRAECPMHGINPIDVPWGGQATKLTRRFEGKVLEYVRISNTATTAKVLNVHQNTVWKEVDHYADVMMRELDLSGLKGFHIDETQCKKRHDYITTVFDSESRATVFATQGNDVSVVHEFRYWLQMHNGFPENIEYVCSDMSASFIKAIEECFPNAMIVHDPFHVVQMATAMLDDVRRTLGLKSSRGKTIRFKILKNRDRLDDIDQIWVDEVFDIYEDLGKAYHIKEAVVGFYNDCPYHMARRYLDHLIEVCESTDVKRIQKFAKSLRQHYDGILRWHEYHLSNGVAEGNNSVIQAMKSSSRGFRNPENMISMVYLRSAVKHPSLQHYLGV